MTGLEITLLLVGIVFMVGSFLITERLSGSELNKVSELSEDEIRRILERELTSAQQKIDTQIEQSIVNSIEQSSDAWIARWIKRRTKRSWRSASSPIP